MKEKCAKGNPNGMKSNHNHHAIPFHLIENVTNMHNLKQLHKHSGNGILEPDLRQVGKISFSHSI
jgi:predicted transcriptional regulator